jgi:hypothetical protein
MSKRNNNSRRPNNRWEVVELIVRDQAAVEVSMLPLPIPRFTFRVGTAHFDPDTKMTRVGPRLTTFNAEDGAELLTEVYKKYNLIREEKIQELERLKEENNGGGYSKELPAASEV